MDAVVVLSIALYLYVTTVSPRIPVEDVKPREDTSIETRVNLSGYEDLHAFEKISDELLRYVASGNTYRDIFNT